MGEEDSTIRIGKKIHQRVKAAAALSGMSVYEWCATVLEQTANEVIAKLTSAAHEQQGKARQK